MIDATGSNAMRLFLSKMTARSPLSETDRQALLALSVEVSRIEAHREFARRGEPLDDVYLVVDGLVSRQVQVTDSKRQHIGLHVTGDLINPSSLVLPTAPASLVAMAPSIVGRLPRDALCAMLARHPEIATAFWRESAIDANITAQWLVSVGRKDSRGRLAHLFCEMAVRYLRVGVVKDGSYPFPVTQEQIADTLGVTTVHVNRSIQALRREGLVQVSRGGVTILDWPGLVLAAEFDPAYLQLPDTACPG